MILALVLTVLIEGAVMFFLTRSKEWVKYNFYCNIVTNPLLNFALWGTRCLFAGVANSVSRAVCSYYLPLFLLEMLVFWGEGRLYFFMTGSPKKYCNKLSVITNAVSMAVGVLIAIGKL